MNQRVRDVMSTEVEVVGPHDKLGRLVALLREHGIRHLPVVDEARHLLGLVSHRDVVSRALGPVSWFGEDEVARQLGEMEARELMTDGVLTIAADVPLAEAARTMLDAKVGCLPVIEDGRLVGILTEGDFVRLAAGD